MRIAQSPAEAQTLHLSPLLRKVQQLVGTSHALSCLKQLAVERGCNHYQGTPTFYPTVVRQLSNEELGIALCLPHFGQEPNSLRIAAEIISADGVAPSHLAHLAAQERCVSEIAYIARCGQTTEPNNPFGVDLLARLPKEKMKPPIQHMPHWTRFAILGGLNRQGEKQVHWLRPGGQR